MAADGRGCAGMPYPAHKPPSDMYSNTNIVARPRQGYFGRHPLVRGKDPDPAPDPDPSIIKQK